ncbi:hypothetical protein ABE288_20455 [Bacillus salipaludis]|uniref:hypothetical protein n=1 Tax=Bacillus salipaludis TaxID=2547811 RepID=UPI003D19B547
MKEREKDYFVAIPNRMFAFETECYATNEELMVFYQLGILVTARNPRVAIANIELLNSELEFDRSNQSRGKQKVREALLSLHDKGYIILTFSDSKLKNNTHITVELPDTKSDPIYTQEILSGSWKYKGFTEVTHDMFDRSRTIDQFKVLIYVKWRSFSNTKDRIEYAISFQEWASILKVTHATANKLIDGCVEDGLIVKHSGQYYTTFDGKIRQETNRYVVKEEEEQKPFDIIKEVNISLHYDNLKVKSKEKRKHNWFTPNSKINDNDVYVYKTTNCLYLREHAKKRIDAISMNENGKKMIENFFEKANQRLKKEEQEKKVQEERDKEMVAQFEDDRFRKWKYKKTKASNDISDILSYEDNNEANIED